MWTEAGLTAPTTLGASAAVRTGSGGRADAGYFSPNNNVNGSSLASPAWTSSWDITVGSQDVEISSIVINTVESNSSGTLGGGNGGSDIVLTFSTFTQTQTRTDEGATPSNLTYTPGTVLTLSANQTYSFGLAVSEFASSSQGHFESLNSITFNGDLIPEPASVSLLALSVSSLFLRRRR